MFLSSRRQPLDSRVIVATRRGIDMWLCVRRQYHSQANCRAVRTVARRDKEIVKLISSKLDAPIVVRSLCAFLV